MFQAAEPCMVLFHCLYPIFYTKQTNFWHWSVQWLGVLQIQHLCRRPDFGALRLDPIWSTGCLVGWPVLLKGVVALILDFIYLLIINTNI